MDVVGPMRLVLTRLLQERRSQLPRAALRFLELLLADEAALSRMRFCRGEERSRLRNSLVISADEIPCWGVMLGNNTDAGKKGAQDRARLAVDGLGLSPEEVMQRLRMLPIWFLAVDPEYVSPPEFESIRIENTVYRMAGANAQALRRTALMDQLDAALDDGDRAAFGRLCELLKEVS